MASRTCSRSIHLPRIVRPALREGLINQLFALSFLRKQESSAFTFNDLKALDPSFRWDDEQN